MADLEKTLVEEDVAVDDSNVSIASSSSVEKEAFPNDDNSTASLKIPPEEANSESRKDLTDSYEIVNEDSEDAEVLPTIHSAGNEQVVGSVGSIEDPLLSTSPVFGGHRPAMLSVGDTSSARTTMIDNDKAEFEASGSQNVKDALLQTLGHQAHERFVSYDSLGNASDDKELSLPLPEPENQQSPSQVSETEKNLEDPQETDEPSSEKEVTSARVPSVSVQAASRESITADVKEGRETVGSFRRGEVDRSSVAFLEAKRRFSLLKEEPKYTIGRSQTFKAGPVQRHIGQFTSF